MHVESYQWQIGLERILILPLAPCGFDTPYLGIIIDVVGPPSAEVCRKVANFPQVNDLSFTNPWVA